MIFCLYGMWADSFIFKQSADSWGDPVGKAGFEFGDRGRASLQASDFIAYTIDTTALMSIAFFELRWR